MLRRSCCTQLATVCHKFADAAGQVSYLHKGLDLEGYEQEQPGCLDSELLLSWAGFMRMLILCEDSFGVLGLIEFAASATKISEVWLYCTSLAAEAQADFLLSRMQCTSLQLHGPRYPGTLPLSLQELTISHCLGP